MALKTEGKFDRWLLLVISKQTQNAVMVILSTSFCADMQAVRNKTVRSTGRVCGDCNER